MKLINIQVVQEEVVKKKIIENKQKTKNTDLSPNFSLIILNVNSPHTSTKRYWQGGLENMTQLYVVCKKCTSNITPLAGWNQENGKSMSSKH